MGQQNALQKRRSSGLSDNPGRSLREGATTGLALDRSAASIRRQYLPSASYQPDPIPIPKFRSYPANIRSVS